VFAMCLHGRVGLEGLCERKHAPSLDGSFILNA
jgi:hypothetical protein